MSILLNSIPVFADTNSGGRNGAILWIADKTKLGVENLVTLAKRLKLSADLLVLEEGQNSQELRVILEEIIREVVRSEMKKLSEKKNSATQNRLSEFFESNQIPEKDKDKILRRIKKLLKIYNKSKSKG